MVEVFMYSEDYYGHLWAKENNACIRFHGNFNEPGLRKKLLDTMSLIHSKFNLLPNTYHLAVYLLDVYLDNYSFDEEREYVLLASACVYTAAKYVDLDEKVPNTSKLLKLVCQENSTAAFCAMEEYILDHFQWNLNITTSFEFLENMTSQENYRESVAVLCETVKKRVQRRAKRLVHWTLTDVEFRFYEASLVAAACLASARLKLNLHPTWPVELESLTRYKYHDIKECVAKVMALREVISNFGIRNNRRSKRKSKSTKWKGKKFKSDLNSSV